MDVAFVEDHLSVTGWPAWAEAGEALRATLGDAGGANWAATAGLLPSAISATATKLNKSAARSEWTRILIHLLCNGAFTRSWKRAMSPTHWCKDCGIERGCKLFLGAGLEQA